MSLEEESCHLYKTNHHTSYVSVSMLELTTRGMAGSRCFNEMSGPVIQKQTSIVFTLNVNLMLIHTFYLINNFNVYRCLM